jgi:hypothetical protein
MLWRRAAAIRRPLVIAKRRRDGIRVRHDEECKRRGNPAPGLLHFVRQILAGLDGAAGVTSQVLTCG